jgi:hypothetical protein
MGQVIVLSELERARPARSRRPLPAGGATISLFLGVRYDRPPMALQAAALADAREGEPRGLGEAQLALPAPAHGDS